MGKTSTSKKDGKSTHRRPRTLSLILTSAPLPTIAFISPLSGFAFAINTPVNANGFCSGALGAVGLNGVLVNANDDSAFFQLVVTVSGAKSTSWQTTFGAPAAGNWILQIWSSTGGVLIHAEITVTAH